MKLELLNDIYKVLKYKPDEKLDFGFLSSEEIYSITKTTEELSIVVRSDSNTKSDIVEDNWRIIKIVGILDFSLVGILSKISTILSNANISIFAISTYNTDYILVKDDKIKQAVNELEKNNYEFI